jgi:hypothetical protein
MNEMRIAMERSADAHPVEFVDEPPPPTFGDAVRYLWERRVRLAKYFFGLLCPRGRRDAGVELHPRAGRGSDAVPRIQGDREGEYSNGRKFAIGDIRSPKVIQKANLLPAESMERADVAAEPAAAGGGE